MFYKKNYIEKKLKEKLQKENSLEFCLAIKQHLSHRNIEIKAVEGINLNGEKEILEYIPVDIESENIFMLEDNMRYCKWAIEDYQRKYEKHKDVTIIDIETEVQDCLKINSLNIFNQILEIVSQFDLLEEEININDINGEEYTIKIHSNTDSSLNDSLNQDCLYLYKGQEKIGYMKMKYTTQEMNDFYFPTKIHKYLDQINQDYLINLDMSKEEILKKMEEKKFIKDVDYSDIEKEYKKHEKKLYSRAKEEIEDYDKRWINMATSEYSRLEEDYKSKGLAQLMYFYMARHLNKKNVKLRSSTNLSEEAKKLWKNIEKNFSDNIEKNNLGKNEITILNVSPSEKAQFKNGKLEHTTDLEEFLKNKKKVESEKTIVLKYDK